MTRKVAVVGAAGYVGSAMCRFFERRYTTLKYDLAWCTQGEHCGVCAASRDDCNKADLGVVCVPTPMREDGSCDTSHVEDVLSWLDTPLIVIKSTVPPGTTDRLAEATGKALVFSPEFIGESSYHSSWGFESDVAATPWFIFGASHGRKTLGERVADIYAPIAGPQKTYRVTDATTAELVKLVENTYFFQKVMFANQLRQWCEAFGTDYHETRELWALDPRVEKMHTLCFADNRGAGGKCYPKDTLNLLRSLESRGVDDSVLAANIAYNMQLRLGKGDYPCEST